MEQKIKQTINAYEGYANYYIKRHNQWDEVLPYKLIFSELLDKQALILDVGFGTTRDMAYFRNKGFRTIGIDLCDTFLQNAKEKGFDVFKMDMRNLAFKDEQFDGLWVSASFYHVPSEDIKKTVDGFYRVLKPNGILFVSVKKGEGEGYITKDVYKKGTKMWYVFYDKNKLLNVFRRFRVLFLANDRRRGNWISAIFKKA